MPHDVDAPARDFFVYEPHPPAPLNPLAELSAASPLGSKISWGELIASVTVLYALAVASFNAGYFDRIPDRFVQLFSFSDMLGSNIPVLQYMIGLYVTYAALFLITFWFLVPFWERHNWRVQVGLLEVVQDARLFAAVAILLGVIPVAIGEIEREYFNNTVFSLEFIPLAISQWLILHLTYTGYKVGSLTKKTLVVSVALNMFFFSYLTGKMWLRYETLSPRGNHAVMTNSIGCIDRKLLRASSNGYLFYNLTMKQYEYRDRSDIRTLFDKPGCL